MIENNLKRLFDVDSAYKNIEDKNYYLVHKYNEIIQEVSDEDVKELQTRVIDAFEYSKYNSFLEYVIACSKNNLQPMKKTYNPMKLKKENMSIMNFYDEFDTNLLSFIKGHLFLEYSLDLIIEKALKKKAKNLKFSSKVQTLFLNGLISVETNKLLKKINKVRNNIAHDICYQITFDQMFDLVSLSVRAQVDYSENTIYCNKKLSYEWYGIEGIIVELFPNTFCFLIEEHSYLFSDEEMNKLLV